jgi:predicted lipoprotein with Yx(FWY)xxD motif
VKKFLMAFAFVSSISALTQAADPVPLTTTVTNDQKEVLVADSFGRTLYTFDLDTGATASQCNGACAEVWPPYLISADEAATLTAPLGALARANKKMQLTYNGSPVYTYMLDRFVTDEKGDGLGGVWHYIEIK